MSTPVTIRCEEWALANGSSGESGLNYDAIQKNYFWYECGYCQKEISLLTDEDHHIIHASKDVIKDFNYHQADLKKKGKKKEIWKQDVEF